MKLLTLVSDNALSKAKPLTAEEINAREDSERIWATIAQCKLEAQEQCRSVWEDAYWKGKADGRFDREE